MVIPLYQNNSAPKKFKNQYNAGLWYDKFCNQWRIASQGHWTLQAKQDNSPKAEWIKTLNNKKIGDSALIASAVNRQAAMVCALGGQLRVFSTEWNFVTGLGRDHPVENGFAWHHTLGTAYLPGSSLKGMIRAWAREWEEDESKKKAINRIFGSDQGEKHVGSVIFFDALPLTPVSLKMDVMTPHYSQYYKNDKPSPPGDWMSPEPIQFLTVDKEQKFLFTLAPRCLGDEKVTADLTLALEWLEKALEWLGAGAKTAAGYGRFVRLENEEEKLLKKLREEKEQAEEEARLQQMSPLQREMEKDGYSTNFSAFMEAMTTKWLNRMEAGDISPEERVEIADLLMKWYQEYNSQQWNKPTNKKNKEKIDRIKNILGK